MTRIPVIHNVSLQMPNYNSTTINGTCNECLCTMLLNITLIFAFNCFQNNRTCEIFSQSLNTNSFLLINNTASSVYFISLPTNDSTLASTSTTQNTSELLLLYSDAAHFFKYYLGIIHVAFWNLFERSTCHFIRTFHSWYLSVLRSISR